MGKTILVSAATVVLTIVALIGIAYSANIFQVDRDGTVRLVVTDTGNVGIGADSPGSRLTVRGSGTTSATSAFDVQASDGTSRVFVRDDGNVGIGTTAPGTIIETVATTSGAIRSTRNEESATAQFFTLRKSRGTAALPAIVQNNDVVAQISLQAHDGAAYFAIANIGAEVDGVPGLNDLPGRLIFRTSPDGSATSVERMRINNAGNVGIGTTIPTSKLHVVGLPVYANNAAAVAGGLTPGAFYRTGGDPDLICVVH